jgi:energy-coupling factor transporter ATP-binding protein EcfA2
VFLDNSENPAAPSVASYDEGLIPWWVASRPFFLEHNSEIVAQIDDDIERLKRLMAADPSFVVCFLGQSGVGKSTLLNAIVGKGQTIVPAGGIGPLTALETTVRFSETPYIRVRYQSRRVLDGYRLQLDKQAKAQRDGTFSNAEPELDTESVPDSIVSLVAKVIYDNQQRHLSSEETLAGLRAILGQQYSSTLLLTEEDQSRLSRAAKILAESNQREVRYTGTLGDEHFRTRLAEHVSGYLAPLVEMVEIGYPSDLLREGIVVVDLPGLGVANDAFRDVTHRYVKQKARGLVLVVNRSGITEAQVDLIRETGYWERLLLSSRDPEKDPCSLSLVVTQLDLVAKAERLDANPKPRLADVFANVLERAKRYNLETAKSVFSGLVRDASGDKDFDAATAQAFETLLSSLEVYPMAATEYCYYELLDEEEPSFLRRAEDTGVPAFSSHLRRLAVRHREAQDRNRRTVRERIIRNVDGALSQLRAKWASSSAAVEEAAQLREELRQFLDSRRLRLNNEQGALRAFFKEAGPARISGLVAKAQLSAQREIESYLTSLKELHWNTLAATVRRGGEFVSGKGRRVDLAADISTRFQEPVAGIWSQTILKEMRQRTAQHARALEYLVGEIGDWASGRPALRSQMEPFVDYTSLIHDRAAQLETIGDEAIEELKNAIKVDLMQSIEKPIRKRCEAFAASGNAHGTGVKSRILDLFTTLAREAVDAAGVPAERLLQHRFSIVHKEIIESLEAWGDPLEQGAEILIHSEEQRRRIEDQDQRSRILKLIDQASQGVPRSTEDAA